MRLVAIALSVAATAFACASGMYDSWEMKEQNFATPALEEALSGDNVYANSEEFGKCMDSAASAAQKVCGGGPTPGERACRERKTDEYIKQCREVESSSNQKQTTTIFSPFGGGQITGEKK